MTIAVNIEGERREIAAHPRPAPRRRLIYSDYGGFKRIYAPALDKGMDAETALRIQSFRAELLIRPRAIERGTIEIYEHMVRCTVSQTTQPDWLRGVTRGEISADFMGKKRKRMLDKMNSWRMPKKHGLFVTLTYPDEYPLDWRRWKADLEKWRRKLLTKFPQAEAIWRLELQRRGAPHYHVILYTNERITVDEFIAWNDPVWAEIAHRGDQYGGEFACNVRRIHSPGHAVAYAGKYASKFGQAPADDNGEIMTPASMGDTQGRQWGTIGKPDFRPYHIASLTVGTLDCVRRQLAVWGTALSLRFADRLWTIPKYRSWTVYGMGENPTRDTRIDGCDPPPVSRMLLQYATMAVDKQVWNALL